MRYFFCFVFNADNWNLLTQNLLNVSSDRMKTTKNSAVVSDTLANYRGGSGFVLALQ